MSVIALLRPTHWVKNLLVFAPLFFGGALYDQEKATAAFIAYCAFCLIASGGYAWNDMLDKEKDAKHLEKRFRPIPQGTISSLRAGIAGFTASCAGIAVALAYAPVTVPIVGTYVALSAIYSLYVKRIPIIELLFFPAFYLARIFAGGMATRIVISHWLILCIIFISLFLIIIKRTVEKDTQIYSQQLLKHMTVIFGSAALMSYGLYTTLGARSPYAIYSIFFPVAGIMRYLMLAEQKTNGEFPEKIILKDPFIAITIVLWIIYMYVLLY